MTNRNSTVLRVKILHWDADGKFTSQVETTFTQPIQMNKRFHGLQKEASKSKSRFMWIAIGGLHQLSKLLNVAGFKVRFVVFRGVNGQLSNYEKWWQNWDKCRVYLYVTNARNWCNRYRRCKAVLLFTESVRDSEFWRVERVVEKKRDILTKCAVLP